MEQGGPPEKWAATQCLAMSGVITDKIIVELVNHLHADNAVRTEKAGTLLAQLSQKSVSQSTLLNVCGTNAKEAESAVCFKLLHTLFAGRFLL